MNPRKKESKKWSAIPAELSNQIRTVFEQNFQAHLNEKTIKVQGRIYPSELLLQVGIHNKGELRHNNFQVSLDYAQKEQNIVQKIHIAVDAIASLMLEFFENEDADLPYSWQQYPFEKEKIWFQFSTENPDLEKEANKLLGIDDETLLVDDMEDDDIEVVENLKSSLVGDDDSDETSESGDNESDDLESDEVDADDEEIDLKKPSLFKSKKKKKDDLH